MAAADGVQFGLGALVRLTGPDAAGPQPEGRVLEHAQVLEEQGALLEHRDAAPVDGHVRPGARDDRAVDRDGARVGAELPADELEDGRLARTVGPDEGDDRAGRDGQVGVESARRDPRADLDGAHDALRRTVRRENQPVTATVSAATTMSTSARARAASVSSSRSM